MRRYAPAHHRFRDIDVGALLHQVLDSVHFAITSCKMERRVFILRTSQSGCWHLQATPRTPNTHLVLGLDVGALANEFTQLRHVTSAGGINKLFVHLFLCLCLPATLPHEELFLDQGVNMGRA
jgi:hypothetical protein